MSRVVGWIVVLAMVGAVAACGGSSQPPKDGDCIDAQHSIVSCNSSSSRFKLLSLNDPGPNETACLVIDNPPQVRLKVDGHYFCAQPTK
jgi:hypothetical protein